MALKIRRGTEAQRSSIQFALGELVVTTDTHRLYIGDGIEPGGHNIATNLAGTGLTFNETTNRLDVNYNGLNSDVVSEGSNNLYFTTDRAQDAVGTALAAGNAFNVGITFTYDDLNNRITAQVTDSLGLPSQLGNNGKFLTTDGATPSWATIDALPSQATHNGQFLTTDGSTASWATPLTGLLHVSEDINPSLGGDLTLNTHNITGTGNIDINGSITSNSTITNGTVTLTSNAVEATGFTFNIANANPALSIVVNRTLPDAVSHTMVESKTTGSYGTGLDTKVFRGTLASKLIVQAGDSLLTDSVAGWNGTAYQYSSAVIHVVDPYATVSGSSIPGAVGLVTWNSNNTADLSKSLFVDSRGYVSIGLTTAAQATLDVNGFAKLAILTSPPASPANGMIAIADGVSWNPTSTGVQTMVVYLGGAWKTIAQA
jgi:hypothetical protein